VTFEPARELARGPPPILHARFAPDGQISKNLSSPFRKNISVFPKLKSGYMICHPVPQRGVSRSSRTREGMRWTRQRRRENGVAGRLTRERSTGAQDDGAFSVRQNRVVPTPVAGAKLSVAASIRPDPMCHQAGSDGDKTNSLAGESTA
jgi:hypothetical protein